MFTAMSSREIIRFINPEKQLTLVLALTLAIEVLSIFESAHPNDLRPREAIELSFRVFMGEEIGADDLFFAASKAYSATDDADYRAKNAGCSAANTALCFAEKCFGVSNIQPNFYWAEKAVGSESFSNLVQGLIPLIIDYAIQNQIRLFTGPGNFDEVFESLPEDYRDKVWYNMELFGT